MDGVLDEDYNVLDTVATTPALENDTFDDSRSISSTASHKKPLYKRAWRKVQFSNHPEQYHVVEYVNCAALASRVLTCVRFVHCG